MSTDDIPLTIESERHEAHDTGVMLSDTGPSCPIALSSPEQMGCTPTSDSGSSNAGAPYSTTSSPDEQADCTPALGSGESDTDLSCPASSSPLELEGCTPTPASGSSDTGLCPTASPPLEQVDCALTLDPSSPPCPATSSPSKQAGCLSITDSSAPEHSYLNAASSAEQGDYTLTSASDASNSGGPHCPSMPSAGSEHANYSSAPTSITSSLPEAEVPTTWDASSELESPIPADANSADVLHADHQPCTCNETCPHCGGPNNYPNEKAACGMLECQSNLNLFIERVAVINNAYISAKETSAKHQKDIASKNVKIDKLTRTITKKHKEASSHVDKIAQLSALNAQLKAKLPNKEQSSLHSRNPSNEKLYFDNAMKTKEAEINQLRQKVKGFEGELKDIKKANKLLEKKVTDLNNSMIERPKAANRIQILKADLEHFSSQLEASQNETKDLKLSLAAEKVEVAKLTQQREKLRQQVTSSKCLGGTINNSALDELNSQAELTAERVEISNFKKIIQRQAALEEDMRNNGELTLLRREAKTLKVELSAVRVSKEQLEKKLLAVDKASHRETIKQQRLHSVKKAVEEEKRKTADEVDGLKKRVGVLEEKLSASRAIAEGALRGQQDDVHLDGMGSIRPSKLEWILRRNQGLERDAKAHAVMYQYSLDVNTKFMREVTKLKKENKDLVERNTKLELGIWALDARLGTFKLLAGEHAATFNGL